MNRLVVEFDGLEGLAEAPVLEPVRFVFTNPRHGGPALSAIRACLAPKGRIRITATPARTHVDLDPGEPEAPRVALDTIVRSDAAGLERMLLSVIPHVDEIVLGVDGRSDDETRAVAEAYADHVHTFNAADIGLDDAAWEAGKIHFANARNVGRARVKAPWTLVLDSDEYLKTAVDFRELVSTAPPEVGAFSVALELPGFVMKDDHQRFTRTIYRWSEGIHNQINVGGLSCPTTAAVASDNVLREHAEIMRRNQQRDLCIEDLAPEAAKGNLAAVFHLTKHRAAKGDIEAAAKDAEAYRLQIEPHSVMANERIWIALAVAFRYYNEDKFDLAELWAVRALFDGPNITTFCLLGDIAEDQGDLLRARGWYEAACAQTTPDRMDWPGVTSLRSGRLAGIKRALEDPKTATYIGMAEDLPAADQPPASA
jgi:hypothetical protein